MLRTIFAILLCLIVMGKYLKEKCSSKNKHQKNCDIMTVDEYLKYGPKGKDGRQS